MDTQTRHITVLLPDDKYTDVSYYCSDRLLKEKEKALFTRLYIQLHDCLCTFQIEKSLCKDLKKIEMLVHNKVINAKGHLCE